MKKKADICRSAWPPVRLPSNFGCTLHTLHDVHWLPPGRKMHSHGAPDPDGLYRTGAAKLSALSRDVIARGWAACVRGATGRTGEMIVILYRGQAEVARWHCQTAPSPTRKVSGRCPSRPSKSGVFKAGQALVHERW